MAVFGFLSDGKGMWLVLRAVKERKIWEWQVSSRAVQQHSGLSCRASFQALGCSRSSGAFLGGNVRGITTEWNDFHGLLQPVPCRN